MMQSYPLLPTQGVHGWHIIRCADQKVLASQNAEQWFPLASTAKLVLAAVVVDAILSPHEVFNLTGGLPTAVMDAGILRGFTRSDQVVYVLAGKDLADRSVSQASDVALAKTLVGFYESSKS